LCQTAPNRLRKKQSDAGQNPAIEKRPILPDLPTALQGLLLGIEVT